MADRPTPVVTDDPDTLLTAMAATRKALARDLRAVRTLLLPSSERTRPMATTKAMAKTSADKRTAKPAAKSKSAPKASPKARRTGMAGKAMKEVKEVLGDVLAKAATGAVRGAASAVAGKVEDVSEKVRATAKKANPNANGGSAKKGPAGRGKKSSGEK
jgi:hypothetical protein